MKEKYRNNQAEDIDTTRIILIIVKDFDQANATNFAEFLKNRCSYLSTNGVLYVCAHTKEMLSKLKNDICTVLRECEQSGGIQSDFYVVLAKLAPKLNFELMLRNGRGRKRMSNPKKRPVEKIMKRKIGQKHNSSNAISTIKEVMVPNISLTNVLTIQSSTNNMLTYLLSQNMIMTPFF